MAKLETGTIGTCRHCGDGLVYGNYLEPNPWREGETLDRLGWHHLNPMVPEQPAYCTPPEDLPDELQKNFHRWKKAQPREYCQERLEDGLEICNRKASADFPQFHACGIHGRKLYERSQWGEKRQLEYDLKEFMRDEIQRVMEELKEFWGIECHAETSYSGPTGYICVNPGSLIQKLREKEEMEDF